LARYHEGTLDDKLIAVPTNKDISNFKSKKAKSGDGEQTSDSEA
jgi:hypothetical protein